MGYIDGNVGPRPIAMLRSAGASAWASLIPSPAIVPLLRWLAASSTKSAFPVGNASAWFDDLQPSSGLAMGIITGGHIRLDMLLSWLNNSLL